jgi:hypothetical protein
MQQKSRSITKQIVCAKILLILLCFVFSACANNSNPQVVAIIAPVSMDLETDGSALPEVKLKYSDGTEKPAVNGDLWFIA